MKALTLTEPWCSLVALEKKRIETRSWGTKYRGLLAIHAAKGFPRSAKELCLHEPFSSALSPLRTNESSSKFTYEFSVGEVIAVARLTACEVMTPEIIRLVPEPERSFGHYEPGRYMWMLADIWRLPRPIPAKGALGLWEWDDQIAEPLLDVREALTDWEHLTQESE